MEDRRVQLIEQHLTLVEHVVRRLMTGFPRHVDRSELESAGRLGLTEGEAVRLSSKQGEAEQLFHGFANL